jgi:hypothetical protein
MILVIITTVPVVLCPFLTRIQGARRGVKGARLVFLYLWIYLNPIQIRIDRTPIMTL